MSYPLTGVNWDHFPADVEHARPDATGFRGFVVEFYNVISDVVVQDGYQSVLNLRTVLHQISARHPRITRCSRESDGVTSYNSVFVALFQLQLGRGGKSGKIKIIKHGHNEPGHGSDICDTAGANCIRECWRCTKRTGLSIISAYRYTQPSPTTLTNRTPIITLTYHVCVCLQDDQMSA